MGAAIAAGSHEEKGTCALLVIAANMIIMAVVTGSRLLIVKTFH